MRKPTLIALILVPTIIFFGLYFSPQSDPLWQVPFVHFYVVSYASLVALVVASFVATGVGVRGDLRAHAVAMSFVAMAAVFTIHGGTTPGVITGVNQVVGWAARLSLTAGAIPMSIATSRWAADMRNLSRQQIQRLWLVFGIAYGVFLLVSFGFPQVLQFLTNLQIATVQVASLVLALFTGGLFAWSAWRAWLIYQQEPRRLTFVLTFCLPWLVLAQVSQYIGVLWQASWWMYHALMMGAFVVCMGALVMDYEEILRFNAARYFTAIGVILGVPLVGLVAETAVSVTGNDAVRWPLFFVTLAMLSTLFSALLLVVQRAGNIMDERQQALLREKQWRTDFTNLIVHDLKSPLTVIITGSDLVLNPAVGHLSEQQVRHVERVRRGGKEMLDMIDNLLDVEKLEAGALRLQPDIVNIDQLLAGVVDNAQPVAEAYEINVDYHNAIVLPEVRLDAGIIKRVLENLLMNAIKFTPRGGHIWLDAMPTRSDLTISISDTGPGVPPDERGRIFEKFVQLQGMERRGAGLGLAFCKLAVEAHGGHIWVDEANGGGSRFNFSIPIMVTSGAKARR